MDQGLVNGLRDWSHSLKKLWIKKKFLKELEMFGL